MELIPYDIRFILQTLILYHQRDIFYPSKCTTSIEKRYVIPKNDKNNPASLPVRFQVWPLYESFEHGTKT